MHSRRHAHHLSGAGRPCCGCDDGWRLSDDARTEPHRIGTHGTALPRTWKRDGHGRTFTRTVPRKLWLTGWLAVVRLCGWLAGERDGNGGNDDDDDGDPHTRKTAHARTRVTPDDDGAKKYRKKKSDEHHTAGRRLRFLSRL